MTSYHCADTGAHEPATKLLPGYLTMLFLNTIQMKAFSAASSSLIWLGYSTCLIQLSCPCRQRESDLELRAWEQQKQGRRDGKSEVEEDEQQVRTKMCNSESTRSQGNGGSMGSLCEGVWSLVTTVCRMLKQRNAPDVSCLHVYTSGCLGGCFLETLQCVHTLPAALRFEAQNI
eukprot:1158741-Pelagomonas_calceolata.AAC.11